MNLINIRPHTNSLLQNVRKVRVEDLAVQIPKIESLLNKMNRLQEIQDSPLPPKIEAPKSKYQEIIDMGDNKVKDVSTQQ